MKHPIRRRFMYLGFQGLRAFVQRLPLGAVRALGRWLGVVAYTCLRTQRRLTIDHLTYALSETLTPLQRRHVARRVFLNLGQNVMEWLRLPTLSTDQLQALITGEGVEHVRRTLAQGNGVIMVTAHFGNWELIALYLRSLGFEGGVLARRLRYPEYESFLTTTLRGRRGVSTFARGSFKEVAKLLRANQIVGILPDQDMDSLDGVFVNFFGHPAYTPIGPAALSLMTGAPIIPCFTIRDGTRFRLVIEPPLTVPTTMDRHHAILQLTHAWSEIIESYIRRYPDHWVWMHRRWKTQPATWPASQPNPSVLTRPGQSMRVSATMAAAGSLLMLCALGGLGGLMAGCSKSTTSTSVVPSAANASATKTTKTTSAVSASSAKSTPSDQQMSSFTLTGYQQDGTKKWDLTGKGASVDGNIVTIREPDGIGYDQARTAYVRASIGQFNQVTRHMRLEHNVTVHTSEGLWLTSSIMHWIPDQHQVATDQPVRIETDHMLLRGRGGEGYLQLKHVTIMKDIELVLNPSDHDLPVGEAQQVTITCDGPLSFDYDHNVATFEQNVHVKDPRGDLYSDKLIAYLNQATHTIRYAEAIGRVRIHQDQNTALSERAVYEPAIGKITLVGKPSLLVYPSQKGGGSTQLSFGGLLESPPSSSKKSRVEASADVAPSPDVASQDHRTGAGASAANTTATP